MSHDKVAGLQGCRVVVKIGVIAEGSAIHSIVEILLDGIISNKLGNRLQTFVGQR